MASKLQIIIDEEEDEEITFKPKEIMDRTQNMLDKENSNPQVISEGLASAAKILANAVLATEETQIIPTQTKVSAESPSESKCSNEQTKTPAITELKMVVGGGTHENGQIDEYEEDEVFFGPISERERRIVLKASSAASPNSEQGSNVATISNSETKYLLGKMVENFVKKIETDENLERSNANYSKMVDYYSERMNETMEKKRKDQLEEMVRDFVVKAKANKQRETKEKLEGFMKGKLNDIMKRVEQEKKIESRNRLERMVVGFANRVERRKQKDLKRKLETMLFNKIEQSKATQMSELNSEDSKHTEERNHSPKQKVDEEMQKMMEEVLCKRMGEFSSQRTNEISKKLYEMIGGIIGKAQFGGEDERESQRKELDALVCQLKSEEEMHERKEKSIIFIQAIVRMIKAKKELNNLKQERNELLNKKREDSLEIGVRVVNETAVAMGILSQPNSPCPSQDTKDSTQKKISALRKILQNNTIRSSSPPPSAINSNFNNIDSVLFDVSPMSSPEASRSDSGGTVSSDNNTNVDGLLNASKFGVDANTPSVTVMTAADRMKELNEKWSKKIEALRKSSDFIKKTKEKLGDERKNDDQILSTLEEKKQRLLQIRKEREELQQKLESFKVTSMPQYGTQSEKNIPNDTSNNQLPEPISINFSLDSLDTSADSCSSVSSNDQIPNELNTKILSSPVPLPHHARSSSPVDQLMKANSGNSFNSLANSTNNTASNNNSMGNRKKKVVFAETLEQNDPVKLFSPHHTTVSTPPTIIKNKQGGIHQPTTFRARAALSSVATSTNTVENQTVSSKKPANAISNVQSQQAALSTGADAKQNVSSIESIETGTVIYNDDTIDLDGLNDSFSLLNNDIVDGSFDDQENEDSLKLMP